MRSKSFHREKKIASRPKSTKKTIIRTTSKYAQNVSRLDFDKMNEILRIRKTKRENNKYGWKLVPKDSCEVYKDRRKKNNVKVSTKDDEKGEETAVNAEKRDSKKTPRKSKKKRKEMNSRQTNEKSKQRRYPNSSSSSYTISSGCSCNTSEMEYN